MDQGTVGEMEGMMGYRLEEGVGRDGIREG